MAGDIGVSWGDLTGSSAGVTLGGGGLSSGGGGAFAGNPNETGGSVTVTVTSNIQTFSASTKDFVTVYGDDLGTATNPYSKTVVTGYKYIDIYATYWVNTRYGVRPVTRVIRTAIIPLYGDNPAYAQFNSSLNTAQNEVYNEQYSDYTSQAEDISTANANSIISQYDNDRYGDTSNISSLVNDIASLEQDIYDLSLEDSLSSQYNMIADTNNTDVVSAKQTEVANLKAELTSSQVDYNKKEFITKLEEAREVDDNRNSGDWNLYFNPLAEEQGIDFSYAPTYTPSSSAQVLKLFMSDSIGDWMAGGNLYDAPRAGDLLFNPTGDLNTIKFLGLEDKNMTLQMKNELTNMAELHKTLNVNAGSDNFSIV